MSNKSMDQAMVNVNGCEVLSVYDEQADQVWAGVGSLCDTLGLDTSTQLSKMRKSESYQGFVVELDIQLDYNYRPGESRGQTRKMWFIDLKRVPFWLCSIQPSRIKDVERRAKLVKFQIECADVLDAYWRGEAIVRIQENNESNFGAALDRVFGDVKALILNEIDNVNINTDKKIEIAKKEIIADQDRKRLELEKYIYDDKKNRQKSFQRIHKEYSRTHMAATLLGYARNKCMSPYCKKPLTVNTAQIDEVFPVVDGGRREWNNVQVLCRSCNNRRKKKSLFWHDTDYRGLDCNPGFIDSVKSEWEREKPEEKWYLAGYPVPQLRLIGGSR